MMPTLRAEQRKPATVSRVLGRSPLSGRRTASCAAMLVNLWEIQPYDWQESVQKKSQTYGRSDARAARAVIGVRSSTECV